MQFPLALPSHSCFSLDTVTNPKDSTSQITSQFALTLKGCFAKKIHGLTKKIRVLFHLELNGVYISKRILSSFTPSSTCVDTGTHTSISKARPALFSCSWCEAFPSSETLLQCVSLGGVLFCSLAVCVSADGFRYFVVLRLEFRALHTLWK